MLMHMALMEWRTPVGDLSTTVEYRPDSKKYGRRFPLRPTIDPALATDNNNGDDD